MSLERRPSEWEMSWDRESYGEERRYYENVLSGRPALSSGPARGCEKPTEAVTSSGFVTFHNGPGWI